MDRVVKFRAWKDNKMHDIQHLEWLENGLKFYGDGVEGIVAEDWRYYWSKEEKVWEDDSVLIQFTGLRDKNDTPIFEGDIVKQARPISKEGQYVFYITGEIIWMKNGYAISDLEDDSIHGYELHIDDTCEVLGNIYAGIIWEGKHYKKELKEF